VSTDIHWRNQNKLGVKCYLLGVGRELGQPKWGQIESKKP